MSDKKILIFGETSYIGNKFAEYLKEFSEYKIDFLNSRGELWKKHNFFKYDIILFVAGIAQISSDPKMEKLYYKVNRDLPLDVADKAKKENIKQFIFMSSIVIYGEDGKIGQKKVIDGKTEIKPTNYYGKSKIEAEEGIRKLEDENFKTVIVRAPRVYGPGSKGVFPMLKKIAKFSPIFPDIENNRSMIYIDNLCEFIKQIIDREKTGIFYPQNKEYISTRDIIKEISKSTGKRVIFIKIFNPLLKLLSKKVNYITKIFGNKVYDKGLSGDFNYCVVDFEESIRRSI